MAKQKNKRGLTIKQKKFAKLYAATGNGSKSAKEAGYSSKTAYAIANENLNKPEIKKAIHESLEESLKKSQLKADHVVEQLRRIAFSDSSDAYNADGTMKHPKDMPEDLRAAIQSIETDEITIGGRIKIGEKKKIKTSDRAKALELLGKYFKIFTDVVENKIEGNLVTGTQEEMDAAVERARKKV